MLTESVAISPKPLVLLDAARAPANRNAANSPIRAVNARAMAAKSTADATPVNGWQASKTLQTVMNSNKSLSL